MPKVYTWSPKRDIQNDRVNGIFVTRVPQGTPNARNFTGKLANGKEYDYWAICAGQVSGIISWIDIVTSDYGSKIRLVLKASKDGIERIHQVDIPFNVVPLREVVNSLCGIAKVDNDLAKPQAFQNVAYYKKDKDGNFVYDGDEKKVVQFLRFEGAKAMIEDFKAYAIANGLEWVKKTNQKGEKEFDTDKEGYFWRSYIIKIQEKLIAAGQAIPLHYNSIIACENPIPDGWPGLDQANLIWVKSWHEQNRGQYQYANSSRPEQVDADDALDAQPQPEQPKAAPEQQKGMTVKASANAPLPDNDPFNFPTTTPSNHNTQPPIEIEDDLPF